MQGGIDLSTPGVMFLGANVVVGVGEQSNDQLALAILACLGIGLLVGFVNGVLVGVVNLNPLIVTLAVGQITLAWGLKYSREVSAGAIVPDALSSWAAEKPLGISAVFWTGAAITLVVALVLRYTAPGRRFQAVGANPRAAWMAGIRVRTHVVFAYTAAGVCMRSPRSCSPECASASTRPSAPRTSRPDRGRRHRRRIVVGRARKPCLDVGRSARAHAADTDAPNPWALDGDAVHRLRGGDHRRDAHLGR